MPMNHQPNIRATQEARENFGHIQTLDSQGITVLKAEEAAGKRTKPVPKEIFYSGTSNFTPS